MEWKEKQKGGQRRRSRESHNDGSHDDGDGNVIHCWYPSLKGDHLFGHLTNLTNDNDGHHDGSAVQLLRSQGQNQAGLQTMVWSKLKIVNTISNDQQTLS